MVMQSASILVWERKGSVRVEGEVIKGHLIQEQILNCNLR